MAEETAGGSSAANVTQGTDQRSQAASAHTDSGTSGASPSQAADDTAVKNPEAKKYADEAAALRVKQKDLEAKLAAFEKAQKDADEAKLTAEEKREREHADLQTKALDYELRLQRRGLKLAGYELKDKLNVADIGAALALVEIEHGGEVKYDADHAPTNLEDLLKDVLKAHPALVLAQQQGSGPVRPTNVGAAMSPARSSVQPGAPAQPGQGAQRFNLADPALWNRQS